jgi:hypothetical protein
VLEFLSADTSGSFVSTTEEKFIISQLDQSNIIFHEESKLQLTSQLGVDIFIYLETVLFE